MGNLVSDINETSFQQQVLQSDKPVLVDFWAEWCAPCRMMLPTVEAIAQQYQGSLHVYKVNVDNNEGLASQYNIKGIPTMLVFKGGVERDRVVGGVTKEVLTAFISKHI